MPYLTLEEIRNMRVQMLAGRGPNDEQLSIRVPKALVGLARQAAGENYLETLRQWMWTGAATSAAVDANCLRGHFSVHQLEGQKDPSIGLVVHDRGWVCRDRKGGTIRAYFEARFDPLAVMDVNFASHLATFAQKLQGEVLAAREPAGRVWIQWGPSPVYLEACGDNLKTVDALLDLVGTSADRLVETVTAQGRRYSFDVGRMAAAQTGDALAQTLQAKGLTEQDILVDFAHKRGERRAAGSGRGR